METASSTPTDTDAPPPPPPPITEEQNQEEAAFHKTKAIQFLGRTTPIVLQNDNGPCPLLAICNVLLLRNSLNLSPDVPEVSQEKLLSLVAERLIDSNSASNNKDVEYVENQQQNISDAIDLLPSLTTGIDVNIKYRRIDDFEFTRECAIFDLLDIPLYHGWIVDPQDHETANSIGSKSYNTLMGELVALEAQSMKSELPKNPEDDVFESQSMNSELPKDPEEDDVDFAAATTATLGVPSPCILRNKSFDESPVSLPDESSPLSLIEPHVAKKGDMEEEADLMRALKLSETELVTPPVNDVSSETGNNQSTSAEPMIIADEPDVLLKENQDSIVVEPKETIIATSDSYEYIPNCATAQSQSTNISEAPDLFLQANKNGTLLDPKENLIATFESYEPIPKCDTAQSRVADISEAGPLIIAADEPDLFLKANENSTLVEPKENLIATSESDEHMGTKADDIDMLGSCLTPTTDSNSSGYLDKPQASASDIDSSEPIYEGEDRILDFKTDSPQNLEPVYEGEVVLAEQVENMAASSEVTPRSEMTVNEGEVIRSFLRSSASQLTVYGLFCLQDGIKERELCVFFRNNHFNTMFKFEGELYILVTDQGYINQPDLVWEKLNEVNGDTLYMTGNFKEFKVDDHSNSAWDEQNAMSSTADYLASIDTSVGQQSNFNSDLQLAIALQQQEFDQQQAQRNNDIQQQPVSGNSGLVTGPQVPRHRRTSTSSDPKQDVKPSKCALM